jgi:hypothetical protein
MGHGAHDARHDIVCLLAFMFMNTGGKMRYLLTHLSTAVLIHLTQFATGVLIQWQNEVSSDSARTTPRFVMARATMGVAFDTTAPGATGRHFRGTHI